MLQYWPVQRLKGGNPTAGLPSGRLATYPKGLNNIFKHQYKDDRTANPTTKYGVKIVK
jgi:hypothetical protein